jgi:predicted RNA-binding Zn ribbon-like protein
MSLKPDNPFLTVSSPVPKLPEIVTLPLVGGRPCLNFANTVRERLDPEKRNDTLGSYSDLLAFSLRQNIISVEMYTKLYEGATEVPREAERVFNAARAFRNTLIQIIDALAKTTQHKTEDLLPPEMLNNVDVARRQAHLNESLEWDDLQCILRPHPEKEGLDLPWLEIVRDAEALLCSPQIIKIKICSAPGCGWVYLDASKNRSRRWCSMKLCGNREKASRFQSKHKS